MGQQACHQEVAEEARLSQTQGPKKRSMKEVPDRNAQFEKIARLRANFEAAGNPVISLDTKKKEMLGIGLLTKLIWARLMPS